MHQDNVVRIRQSYESTEIQVDISLNNLQGFKAKAGTIDFQANPAAFSSMLSNLAIKRRQIVAEGKDSFAHQALSYLASLEHKPAHIEWAEIIASFENTAIGSMIGDDDLLVYLQLVFKEVFIDQLGFDINQPDNRGFTMLMYALASPQVSVNEIAYLVKLGSDIQQPSPFCGRAIHFVTPENGAAPEVFNLLLSYGADPIEDLDYIPFQLFLNGNLGEQSYGRISDFVSKIHLLHDSSRRLLVKRRAEDVLRVIAKYQVNHEMQAFIASMPANKRIMGSGI